MKRYFVYHLRWQISAWVMMPVMYTLSNLELWQSFCISQFFGAIMFWYIDKAIFKNERKDYETISE
jgi:cytosine/uracil/thiamine/allantoin permease